MISQLTTITIPCLPYHNDLSPSGSISQNELILQLLLVMVITATKTVLTRSLTFAVLADILSYFVNSLLVTRFNVATLA